jgi:hypothetical protein
MVNKGVVMVRKMFVTLQALVCAVLVIQFSGCGTLLYPERRGQKGGHVDVGVALLDGVGLLFFLIPGIIAYAVDFSNGTIYMPNTMRSSLDMKNIKQVKFDPKHTSLAGIERIIKDETGYSVSFGQPNMQVTRLASRGEMMLQFAQAASDVQNSRLSLNK